MLELENLSVQISNKHILKQIYLSVPENSILGVIGPNGAGKTTLMRAVSGTIPLSEGTIRFRGRDLTKCSVLERARLIAVVPQARRLPGGYTCRETVMMGRTPHVNWLGHFDEHDSRLATEAMRRTATLDMADRLIGELSGGEQQRVLLARALAQTAPILLLDEPTTHLDLQYQISLLNLIHELVQGGSLDDKNPSLTVLLALHDLNLVGRYADQVAVMVRGAIQSTGDPADVLTPDTLSPAFNLPLRSIPMDGREKHSIIVPANF
ncbi:MAG: ABC transporter ATP-binding protein [Leptolinea sp.]|jgi:iron complex transport system ATP-binding protein|nr:ABC transporter ATP-binding protein [Leptolinea sp.]